MPDVAFVEKKRLSKLPVGFVPFAPDLAVEVVSPSDSFDHVQGKVLDYLAAGTRMVWVIHPGTRTVMVWRSAQSVRALGEEEEISGEDVVPGFACRVAEFFA